jgi:Tfp pilus assembly protein FimT
MDATAETCPRTCGFTLLELSTLLCLLAIVLAGAFPALSSWADRIAVASAREELMGFFHQARGEAVARGGVDLFFTSNPATVTLRHEEGVLDSCDLKKRYRITLALSRDRAEAALTFDAMGLGRVASQTLSISRGQVEARLVVSSLGRVVRQ